MANDRSTLTSSEREKASVFHSWSAQASINPLMVKSAEGVYVTSEDGTTYLDLSSQLVNTNIGHQHPAVVRAIQEQSGTLATIAPQHGYVSRYRAAELILGRSFEGAAKVFFTTGGPAATINLTGDPRRWPNGIRASGVVHFFGPFLYRTVFHATTEAEECQRALQNLEEMIRFEGPTSIAAIVLETIPGTAGIMVPPEGFLAGV